MPTLTTDKIWKGVGGVPTEVDVPAGGGGIWTLFETLSPSGVSTISTSTLDVHDLWMVIIDITMTNDSETKLGLRLNGVSANRYRFLHANGSVLTTQGNTAQLVLGSGDDDEPLTGIVHIRGKTGGDGAAITVFGGVGGLGGAFDFMFFGSHDADTPADITSMTFLTPTMTGKIKIYYMDY